MKLKSYAQIYARKKGVGEVFPSPLRAAGADVLPPWSFADLSNFFSFGRIFGLHKTTIQPTMAKGSKLLSALDRYKGVDHKLEHQKKLQKQAEKRKRSRAEDDQDEAVLEDAIKEAEETVLAPAGKKDKKGAKRAKVEVAEPESEEEDEEEVDGEEWETDDEDKTHAVRSILSASRRNIC